MGFNSGFKGLTQILRIDVSILGDASVPSGYIFNQLIANGMNRSFYALSSHLGAPKFPHNNEMNN